MDKQNVVYTYNGILFSLKKKGHSNTCYNLEDTQINLEDIMLKERSQRQKDKYRAPLL